MPVASAWASAVIVVSPPLLMVLPVPTVTAAVGLLYWNDRGRLR